jgi:predicted porin
MYYESLDIDGTEHRANKIDSASSRIGFQGTEKVGNDLNAFFKYEYGTTNDTPGGGVSTREAWVGLQSSKWGYIRLGSGLTPWDDVLGFTHLLWANGQEGQTSVGGGFFNGRSGNFTNYGSCNSSNFDARYANSVDYKTPSWGGLTFRTHYAFLNENNAGDKCTGWDSAVEYYNGPAYAGVAYALHSKFDGVQGSPAAFKHEGTAWIVSGGWNFGIVHLKAAYQNMEIKGERGSSGKAKAQYWNVGGLVPLGNATIFAQYHDRDNGYKFSGLEIQDDGDAGGKMWTIGAKYNFSKRTQIYGYYSDLNADSNGGGDRQAIGIGLVNLF